MNETTMTQSQEPMTHEKAYKWQKACLLGIAAIQIGMIALNVSAVMKAQSLYMEMQADPMTALATAGMASPLTYLSYFPFILLAASIWALKEMKLGNLKSWSLMSLVFILSLSSWAFPLGFIGFYFMLQDPKRFQIFNELNLKI